jgi:hypothetical protein
MKLPWVSRELYEKTEAERKELLALLLGQDPVDAIAKALPSPDSKEAEDLVDPTTGRLSAEQMRAAFRRATQQPRVG